MKSKVYYPLMLAGLALSLFSSCQKDGATSATQTTTTNATISTLAAAVNSTGSIAIASVAATASTAKDSIYLVGCMPPPPQGPGPGAGPARAKKDSVAAGALPSAITTYLGANYAGYTFSKAFKITDNLNALSGYVAVIKYNSNFVGLRFNADGTFDKVLEQRAGQDLLGPGGFHPGGPFDNRDCKQRDTIALSAIPATVKTFFTITYPADTLLHASVAPDSTYILISKNNGLYATTISPTGKLVNRMLIDKRPGKPVDVAQANLPATITAYLTTTYPGYVFDKAFAGSVNNVIQGYDVFITANSTKYVVSFNATGTFIKVMVVR